MPQSEPVADPTSSNHRRLGVYYTPDSVADPIVRWALPERSGRVLDPSFGGCSFLRSALAAMDHDPVRGDSIYGVDIDAGAQFHAAQLRALGVPRSNLREADFFSVGPSDLGGLFDAVVGNPPYIRHHWHDGVSRQLAEASAAREGVAVGGLADAWAYFVVHSMTFLQRGGRLALLLPISLLHADYSSAVLKHVCANFASTRLIEVSERLFTDASEGTVLLAAAGFQHESRGLVSLERVKHAADLEGALFASSPDLLPADRSNLAEAALTSDERELWHKLIARRRIRLLG
ncbi:MAG TPA: N-6 DNA methylase, partial [Acidimicrobiales bacterium]|nr:N-6 DNA methylase [Acidimicrobiales bacterium]